MNSPILLSNQFLINVIDVLNEEECEHFDELAVLEMTLEATTLSSIVRIVGFACRKMWRESRGYKILLREIWRFHEESEP